jgi:crotonobetainyl-CoA:carnitine CoA-transferase CaiB-like acyl-CoA transferase
MISSLKIIDCSTVLAGPYVGTFFAELGAEVIKIENSINKDVTRSWKVAKEDATSSISAYFSSVNYKKKYLQLNLTDINDRETFLSLIKDADVLISNFKSSDYPKFNIDSSTLLKLNPSLIHGRICGYGKDSDRVAYDLILQAETGFMSMNGTPESGPVKMPVALIDVLAAHQLKEGILLALLERTNTGKGKEVCVSLYESAICSLINQASNYLMNDLVPERIGSLHPAIAPYGELFHTKDEAIITYAIGSDQQFQKLMRQLQLEELLSDERFSNNHERVKHRAELFSYMQPKLKNIDSNEILMWCESNYVPCGKVQNLKEVFTTQIAQNLIREEIIEGKITKRVTSIAFKS